MAGFILREARAGFRPLLADHPQAEELLATFDQLGNYGEPIVRATLAIMGVHDYQHIMVPLQAKPDYAAAEFNSSLTKAKAISYNLVIFSKGNHNEKIFNRIRFIRCI